jgi:nucleoid-associated protein YgaU
MSRKDEDDAPRVDPDTLKGNEVARSVMGSGVRPDGFRVDYRNGTATLFGTVHSDDERRRVVEAARGVGVTVNDSLTIGSGTGTGGQISSGFGATGAGGGRSYTVKSGDTLSGIAKAHYGDASKYNRIFEANRGVLSDPDKIKPGQVLNIPE